MATIVNTLYEMFRDPHVGLNLTADNGSNVLNASNAWLTIKKYPYLQATYDDARPQVIIGPRKPISSKPLIGSSWYEVHVNVKVTVIVRDWDSNTTGFTLEDGETTLERLRDAIIACVKANKSAPYGDKSINSIWIEDTGQDISDPSQSPPLYMTVMGIHGYWLQ